MLTGAIILAIVEASWNFSYYKSNAKFLGQYKWTEFSQLTEATESLPAALNVILQ